MPTLPKPPNLLAKHPSVMRILVASACVCVILFTMRAAQSIIVLMLLAFFLALISVEPLLWFRRRGASEGLSTVLVIVGVAVTGLGLIAIFARALVMVSARLPEYLVLLNLRLETLSASVGNIGVVLPDHIGADSFDPDMVMNMTSAALSSASGLFMNAILVLFMVLFVLSEIPNLPAKLSNAFGDSERLRPQFEEIADNVEHYVVIKTGVSLATGVLITILCFFVGVDFAIMWGIVAFLLNFIPNIGSIIAALPPVALAFIQFGPISAAIVGAGFLVTNMFIGYLVEPRFMGQKLGISPLVIIMSLLLWGWVLGPVGMLLSIPLTIILEIVFDSMEETQWIATLMGADEHLPTHHDVALHTSPEEAVA